MGTHHTSRRALLVPVLGLAFAAAVTACSSNSSSSTTAPTATATTSAPASATASATASPTASATASGSASASALATEPSTGAGATAAIKANWVAFFNGSTPLATRDALLEDGPQYETVLKKVLGSPQGATAGATVQSVTMTSATGANVGYTITLSGTPVLGGQKGTVVYQDGIWKVSVTSFCALATLENSSKPVSGCPTS